MVDEKVKLVLDDGEIVEDSFGSVDELVAPVEPDVLVEEVVVAKGWWSRFGWSVGLLVLFVGFLLYVFLVNFRG